MRLRRILTAASLPLVLGLAACAPAEEEDSSANDQTPTAGADVTNLPECASDKVLTEGTLSIGTDSPAYTPWFVDNDPTNGEGFEAALAYELAGKLGFGTDDVEWIKVPFNNSYQPGAKKFDFDINQISVTEDRTKVVDFSDGYYEVAQAVIALKGADAAEVTSLDELRSIKLGAQTGTTALTAVRQQIKPEVDPLVFEDTNAAKAALENGQVDAIVADLPTAQYIADAEIKDGVLVGRFLTEETEEFGMLFEKGNPLVDCVNAALAELEEEGVLADLEKQWLPDYLAVPELG